MDVTHMMERHSPIPASVLRRARDLLAVQGATPRSPVAVDSDGRVRLCLAAAVAVAGTELYEGTEASTRLTAKIVRSGEISDVIAQFEERGWGAEACSTQFRFNDAQSDQGRREAVLGFLDAQLGV